MIQKAVSWHLEGGVSEGLHVVRIADGALEERLFFIPAEGSPLILGTALAAPEGISTWILIDDDGGWWTTLSLDHGLQADTLDELFQRGRAELEPDSPVEIRLQTSDGLRVTVEATSGDDVADRLVRELRAQNLLPVLAHSLPDELHNPVLFLAGSLGDVHGAMEVGLVTGSFEQKLVEVFAEALKSTYDDAREILAPMTVDELVTGPHLESSRARTLVAQFGSIDPMDPMLTTIPELRR